MSLATEGPKVVKQLQAFDRGLPDELEDLSTEGLQQRALEAQASLMKNERERKDDDDLNTAKAKYDELKKPYDEVKKLQSAVVAYCTLLLEERGA